MESRSEISSSRQDSEGLELEKDFILALLL